MRRMRLKRPIIRSTAVILGVMLSALTAVECDESLPPRSEPDIVLTAALYVAPGRYRFRVYPSADSTQPPFYAASPATVAIQVTNRYDEVLEDSMGLAGTVELWDSRRPNMRSEVNLRWAEIIPSYAVDQGLLTLESQAKITVKTSWFHMIVNSGGPMWQGLELTPDTNAWGEPYFITDTILISARAHLRLFKKLGMVETPLIEVPMSYEIFPSP